MSLPSPDAFAWRHLGPRPHEIDEMVATLGADSLDALVDRVVPPAIRTERPLDLPPALSEAEALAALRAIADENQVWRSYIGMGYHDTHTPPVILRNILENPGWYTAYTPYQAEISQGRLEALLVFQTMVEDLTAMEIANASLLDEATAAAEAMTMSHRLCKGQADVFLVDPACHPQTLAVVRTRARPLGIEVIEADPLTWDLATGPAVFGVLVQYPATDGTVRDLEGLCAAAHDQGALVAVAADLLALTLLRPPGELGADIVVGSSQRFGVPMGYGGPHAAFLATQAQHRRQVPGRIIGVSRDARGQPALRMALQTREQHIRRQKATSNVCTAQVLLAVIAGMYAAWHGPEGLVRIARRVHGQAARLRASLAAAGLEVGPDAFFDTVWARPDHPEHVLARARDKRINLRDLRDGRIAIALDETVTDQDLADLLEVFEASAVETAAEIPAPFARTSPFLEHEVFHAHRSETEMLRYLHRLQARDLALDTSMIPLGSCTMKLNATAEMIPITWREFGGLHPFAPSEQARGYRRIFEQLEGWLAEITGFAAVSLQPNAGSQGEYTGLLTIGEYHRARGESHRAVCLIPTSAHGTNPASAVMAGLRVVTVACDERGNIDLDDLRAKADKHAPQLAALMVTYPSTHGVFEEGIKEICRIVHDAGGLVYMDGANMNALVGLARPGELGADVAHLNLHKTFCIPHGGGGPGMGPIGVAAHLAPFLPDHPVVHTGGDQALGAVAAAPWGSPSILPISWAYIAMMGGDGLTLATKIAILNANYVARRLDGDFDVLYTGREGSVAHECILECRPFKAAGVEVDDIAKRLMDYGFHAPTMSFPVPGTLMVEPTESESKAELDRFCDALSAIRGEVRAVEDGTADRDDNPLKHAPHTARAVTADDWPHAYPRSQAAWPAPWLADQKYWPPVGRIDNPWGDRHLFCSCEGWDLVEDEG
jgi:glycine dehydrogenase (decarboxylating)